ncbi:MAG: nucleotidyltransferase family protein [Candidatus Berkelbacteria bacterium]|nr:nucleotidyltransferase family protein [Candidatus Berkelbacteria bacterium]
MSSPNYQDWRKALLPLESTTAQAIRSLNETAMQIVLVISPNGVLMGTVTDGDIRRSLIDDCSLDQPLSRVVKKIFFSVKQSPSQRGEALFLMKKNRISAIPVVDEQMRPVGIELLLEPTTTREKKEELVVLMAGGMGMRLRPMTSDVPKPMLKVRGKPILQHIIEQLIDQGFQHFAITLNYLGRVIQDFFQDGSAWDVNISYTRENQPLGTAGAVRLIEPAPEKTFVVMNADVISPFDLNDMLEHHHLYQAAATMAVSLQRTDLAYGVVQTKDGKITQIEEKPSLHHLVNAGLYVLEPRTLRLIPEGAAFNMTDLFRDLIAQDESTQAFALYEDWMDIGRPEQYQKANGGDQ